MGLAKGWDRESADLFIHVTGARISRTSYRGKLAWWYFPVSLDVPAVEHAATDEGREEAFATSERELQKPRSRPKPKPISKKKPVASADEDGERERDGDSSPDKEEDDEDKDEGGE